MGYQDVTRQKQNGINKRKKTSEERGRDQLYCSTDIYNETTSGIVITVLFGFQRGRRAARGGGNKRSRIESGAPQSDVARISSPSNVYKGFQYV